MRSGNNGVTAFVVVSLTKSTEDVGLGCVKNILVRNFLKLFRTELFLLICTRSKIKLFYCNVLY